MTSGVCKHKKTILGQKIKRQTLVHIFTKLWWILLISSLSSKFLKWP